jgi:hypothetical protein
MGSNSKAPYFYKAILSEIPFIKVLDAWGNSLKLQIAVQSLLSTVAGCKQS